MQLIHTRVHKEKCFLYVMIVLCCTLLANSMILIMISSSYIFSAVENVWLISKSKVHQHFSAGLVPSLDPSLMRTDPFSFSYSHTLEFQLLQLPNKILYKFSPLWVIRTGMVERWSCRLECTCFESGPNWRFFTLASRGECWGCSYLLLICDNWPVSFDLCDFCSWHSATCSA